MKEISDQDLRFKYPDERELKGWYQSLDDSIQQEYDLEYQTQVPSWHMFLRRKRYETLLNRNNRY